ncbi:MAG: hypothetical protein L3J39_16885 [Verrucomicrobiales bacterium]|nr:hypothetical protein [Verrucomicrobiales bacterium]
MPQLRAADVLHFKQGKKLQGRIEQITAERISLRLSVNLGRGRQGQVLRSFFLKDIEYIDFEVSAEQAALLKQGKAGKLKDWQELWNRKVAFLGQARSNTGELGLVYAQVLLQKDSVYHWVQALELYDLLLAKAWDVKVRGKARIGRVRVLVRQGDMRQANEAALAMESSSGSEELVATAQLLLAQIALIELRSLQNKHPRWQQDEEVLPERQRLYHLAIDYCLKPFLFHSEQRVLAAQGLMAAAELYDFVADDFGKQAVLEDVVEIYPDSVDAKLAREKLQLLQKKMKGKNDGQNKNE